MLGVSDASRRVERERGEDRKSRIGGSYRDGVRQSGRRTVRCRLVEAAQRAKAPTDGVAPVPTLADGVSPIQRPDGVAPVPLRSSKAEGAGGSCKGSGGLAVVVWRAGSSESSASSASAEPAAKGIKETF